MMGLGHAGWCVSVHLQLILVVDLLLLKHLFSRAYRKRIIMWKISCVFIGLLIFIVLVQINVHILHHMDRDELVYIYIDIFSPSCCKSSAPYGPKTKSNMDVHTTTTWLPKLMAGRLINWWPLRAFSNKDKSRI